MALYWPNNCQEVCVCEDKLHGSCCDVELADRILRMHANAVGGGLLLVFLVALLMLLQEDYSSYTSWESLFPSTTSASNVVIPTGRNVILHGCRQPLNTVNVSSIEVSTGATVCRQTLNPDC
jgi:hypothetical protein